MSLCWIHGRHVHVADTTTKAHTDLDYSSKSPIGIKEEVLMGEPKKIKKLMEELGFNQKSSPSAKAAFIKHLAKAAYGVDLKIPAIYDSSSEYSLDSIIKTQSGEQLELPLEVANKK